MICFGLCTYCSLRGVGYWVRFCILSDSMPGSEGGLWLRLSGTASKTLAEPLASLNTSQGLQPGLACDRSPEREQEGLVAPKPPHQPVLGSFLHIVFCHLFPPLVCLNIWSVQSVLLGATSGFPSHLPNHHHTCVPSSNQLAQNRRQAPRLWQTLYCGNYSYSQLSMLFFLLVKSALWLLFNFDLCVLQELCQPFPHRVQLCLISPPVFFGWIFFTTASPAPLHTTDHLHSEYILLLLLPLSIENCRFSVNSFTKSGIFF